MNDSGLSGLALYGASKNNKKNSLMKSVEKQNDLMKGRKTDKDNNKIGSMFSSGAQTEAQDTLEESSSPASLEKEVAVPTDNIVTESASNDNITVRSADTFSDEGERPAKSDVEKKTNAAKKKSSTGKTSANGKTLGRPRFEDKGLVRRKQYSVNFRQDLWEAINRIAVEEDRPFSRIVEYAVIEYLNNRK